MKIQTDLLLILILCGLCISVSTVSADISDVGNNDTVPVFETESDLSSQVAIPTANVTAEPTTTPTPEPTAIQTAEPTAMPTPEPTATQTAEPTATPTPEPVSELLSVSEESSLTTTVNRTFWYVDNSAGPGGNGSELAPFQQIQTALDACGLNENDTVLIAYTGGTPYRNFTVTVPGVTIRGASDDSAAYPVITSPDTSGAVVLTDNVTLSRLNITGCVASIEDDDLGTIGGGILTYECTNTLIKKCILINNSADLGGGVAFIRAEGRLRGSVLRDNRAENGGGVGVYEASLLVLKTNISENSALYGGGVMSMESGVEILSTVCSENTATRGGGIILGNSDGSIHNSEITGNHAVLKGGGIENYQSVLCLSGTSITGNSARTGGGISTTQGLFAISTAIISDNNAKRGGGYDGIASLTGLYECEFTNNSAESGAGISILGGKAEIAESTVRLCQIGNYTDITIPLLSAASEPVLWAEQENSALLTSDVDDLNVTTNRILAEGIGILILGVDDITIRDTTIASNSPIQNDTYFVIGGGVAIFASNGSVTDTTIRNNDAHIGAGLCAFNSDLTLTDNTIRRNNALIAGGGLTTLLGTTTARRNTITNNIAGISGGGICQLLGTVTIRKNTIKRNTATICGGGIQTIGSNPQIRGNTINDNHAGLGGGGICQLTGNATISNNLISGNTAGNGTDLFSGGAGILVAGLDIDADELTLMAALFGNSTDTFSSLLNSAATAVPLSSATIESVQTSLKENISSGTDNQTPHLLTGAATYLSEDTVYTLAYISKNTIQKNIAQGGGGGVKVIGASALIDNSTIKGNTASGAGGGVSGIASELILTTNTIRNNHGALGGGVSGILSLVIALDTHFKRNDGSLYGGGISSIGGITAAYESRFTENTATRGGGGLNSFADRLLLESVTFRNNTAPDGGGINILGFTLSEETIAAIREAIGEIPDAARIDSATGEPLLQAAGEDTGVEILSTTLADYREKFIFSCLLENNNASFGGAIKAADSELFYCVNSEITNNTAITAGGGLYFDNANYSILQNNAVINNTAPEGAGCYLKDSDFVGFANNLFQNTKNLQVVTESLPPADWDLVLNTTYSLVPSISGGPYSGGNIWTNPTGTGFSQARNDTNFDGICDYNYTVKNSNSTIIGTDYLPLYYNLSRGTILVSTNPGGASVLINSISYDRPTPTGYYLPPGQYTVAWTLPGYFDSQVITTSVTAGSTETLTYTFNDTPTFRHTDTGPSPLTFVANATKTASDVSAWTWHITKPDGSVTEMTGRNISTVLSVTGTYTIALNATWENKTTQSEPQTISVLDPPTAPKASEETSAAINGTTVEKASDGTQRISINETAAGNVTRTNTSIQVIKNDGTTIHITTNGTNSTGGNVSGTVRSVTVTPPVLNATISDTVGNASVGLSMTMDTYDEDATITTEIAAGCADDAKNAFSLACPNLNQVAYTVYFTKSGFDNESAISGAVLNFSVNTSWVTSMGGPGRITIIRWKDDGNSTQIIPTYLGISGGESLFQAITDGFSVYGVASVSASPGTDDDGKRNTAIVVAASDLKTGETTVLSFNNEIFRTITLVPAKNISDVLVTMTSKSGLTTGMGVPENATIASYAHTTICQASPSDFSSVTYSARLSMKWLTKEELIPVVWFYNTTDTTWHQLERVNTSIGTEYFDLDVTAEMPGFGWFAIGGVPGEIAEEEPYPASGPDEPSPVSPEEVISSEVTAPTPVTTSPAPSPTATKKATPVPGIIVAGGIGLAAAFVCCRKKE